MIKQLIKNIFFPEISRLTKENIELLKAVKDRKQDIYNIIKYEFQLLGIRSRSKWVNIFKIDEMMLASNFLTTPNELQDIITTFEEIKNNNSEKNPSRPITTTKMTKI